MSGFVGSTRKDRLPPNWPALRRAVLRRDGHACQWRTTQGTTCGARATDVDHIIRGDDHRITNLQSLCGYHHGKKTGSEGGSASALKREAQRTSHYKHPGLT